MQQQIAEKLLLQKIFYGTDVNMSQPAAPPANDALAEITDDDFKEFLNEKIKNHTCPSCMENSWAIITTPGLGLGLIAFKKHGGFTIPPPNIPFMAVACNTCGYIRQHALGMIVQWKAGKKAPT